MKIETSELEGAALNWTVAKCEGLLAFGYENHRGLLLATLSTGESEHFNPTIDWAQGGPIIERERITLDAVDCGETWIAQDFWKEEPEALGPTPLIAAMRCYVAFKLGNEVDVPDELL